MHYYEVAPTQIIRADQAFFTYVSQQALQPGHIVVIEVGKKQLVGIILRQIVQPTYETKPIVSLIEPTPLPRELIALALWMAEYYSTHLATVLQTVLPRGLQKSRRERKTIAHTSRRDRTTIVFNLDQLAALSSVDLMTAGTAILHGITGSGKTHVYIELVKRAFARGQSAIVLVPEIALTSQLIDEFSHHFDDIIVTHSRQTEAQRHLAWQDALTSTAPRLVIGPRSALFMPLRSIGIIVIDEAHEPSFKQEQAPRYSSLRAASVLARHHNAKVLLGSATPAVADYYLAQQSDRPIITMTTSAQADRVAPTVQLIDMTKRHNFKQHRFLSDALLANLAQTLASSKQTLIFHNRRGTTSTTLCTNCGWIATDPDTFLPLTLHADQHILRSHVTGRTWPIPTSCPECNGTDIIHKGIGTKLIESELVKLFPTATIARFDGDSETGESVDQRYKELYDGSIDIIIGTQIVAKGLDLPHLRTVGVIQADTGLSLPDFGATERTFQLLAQVVGRVGRSRHATDVIIQSYQPTHPSVVDGIAQDYTSFYNTALAERKKAYFPPFTYLLKLTCVYKTEAAAVKNAQQLAKTLRQLAPSAISILGPTPAFYERQHDTYRWQLIVKSPKRQLLVDLLQHVPATHWQSELDPISLL